MLIQFAGIQLNVAGIAFSIPTFEGDEVISREIHFMGGGDTLTLDKDSEKAFQSALSTLRFTSGNMPNGMKP